MDDAAFLGAFESCTLPKEALDHLGHVRMAFLVLGRNGDVAAALQRYVGAQGRGSSRTAVSFVEVSEGLKLTREQKEQVENGEELAKVLDERQQAKWKEMLGKPFSLMD